MARDNGVLNARAYIPHVRSSRSARRGVEGPFLDGKLLPAEAPEGPSISVGEAHAGPLYMATTPLTANPHYPTR